ncbi:MULTISPECIES: TnsA endonuclease N-terminal domain-containing protein [Pseudomonas putida group]|uniref:TnsA endonuclease N-terminal domain-containing protein n=1 Tax=Pseudomonas putida group TaxID=136845 RepID=UPI0005793EC9|nr:MULTISPECIES: TnsA endonuclease N-terminal domain-containing protein [Pseudomonas putida group]MCL8300866.1 TnsA endonuclease N-terminal domain-containing protein [Pseudomonas mosselii]MCL8341238.1 TnsA endonuclease N-terminal domain-containing protein [Pseudomonas mosselii]WJR28460.1 TnsA endonuclease N-terminal domain-containing protein [Pseudomonas mosselii]
MRGRRFASKQDIERHIANGFGSGAGVGYVPWLRVQDVPSMGRSHKIPGVKVERIHHLLSDLERAYLLVCEFSEDVVDIREQYPLLPVESTQAIAKAIGVRYPRYKSTALPLVMTTDFLLTVRLPNGDFKSVARTIKYQQDLKQNSPRTLEKLDIERRFWMSQGVDWAIVTEEMFTPDLIKNLGLLRRYSQLPCALMTSSLHVEFLELLESSKAYPWATSECLRRIAARLGVAYGDARDIFFHLIWRKVIQIDLSSAPFHLKSPLPDFKVIYPSDLSALSEGSL